MGEEVKYKQESTRSLRAVLAVLVLGFCLAVAAVIVLAVTLANNLKDEEEKDATTVLPTPMPNSEPDPCNGNSIDVAIVGAGVSGVYSAYIMSQNHDWNIHIYDTNDRVGGRTFSIPMPGISDFKADIGAMRFKQKHKRLLALAEELELTIQPFNTPNENETLYYLRGEIISKSDLAAGNVPYDMTDEERALVFDPYALQVYWTDKALTNESKDGDYWDRVCTDGKMAYEKGIFNAFLEVGSLEGIQYSADASGFPGEILNNLNFADWSDTEYASGPAEPYYTFKEGFQEITLRMMEEVLQSTRNQLFLNHELKAVSHNGTMAMLHFMDKTGHKMTDICAKDVVLGLPGEALKNINFMDKDIANKLKDLLPAVKQGPATKTFLVYDNAWWRSLGKGQAFENLRNDGVDLKFVVSDLPTGMILEIGVDDETGKAMLLIYNDWWKNVYFWSPYFVNGERHNSEIESEYLASEKLIRQVNIQLAKVFNISVDDVPMPLSSVSHGWFEAPYWTGWHDKTPGYHFPTVMEKVLKPISTKGVYIVGEAFSNYQAWCEGALETAQNMLTQHFSITV